MTKEMAQFRDVMTTRWTEQGRRIDFWYKCATKLLGGQIDLLPNDTRLIAPEVLRSPDYLHLSGMHPAFRETFKDVTRHSELQMVLAHLPGFESWQACGVISTWASIRARRQNGPQAKAGEGVEVAATAKAKAPPKQR